MEFKDFDYITDKITSDVTWRFLESKMDDILDVCDYTRTVLESAIKHKELNYMEIEKILEALSSRSDKKKV